MCGSWPLTTATPTRGGGLRPHRIFDGDVTTIHSRKAEVVLEELTRLVQTYQVDELVMGFPGIWTGRRAPGGAVPGTLPPGWEATGLKPVLWDERRTTVDAHRILFDAGKTERSGKRRWTRWRPP